jgi:hypothetical protein
MNTTTTLTNKNWDEARKHLEDTKDQYIKLIGQKQANPFFALANLSHLESRYYDGERTLDLYIQMMKAQ